MTRLGNAKIVTLSGYENFGNRIQAYALQEVLSVLGFDAEVLRVSSRSGRDYSRAKLEFDRAQVLTIRGSIAERRDRKYGKDSVLAEEYEQHRRGLVRQFSNEYIRERDYDQCSESFDVAVVGSDQVWNPFYTHANPAFFCEGLDSKLKVSYAASVGISRFGHFSKRVYSQALSDFDFISVREKSVQHYLATLLGKDVSICLDPTLLAGRALWQGLVNANGGPLDFGRVSYFLDPTQEYRLKESGQLLGVRSLIRNYGGEAYGPVGFLQAILGAEEVLTDSYHATCFSLMFGRPVRVFGRRASNSRLATLLSFTGEDSILERLDGGESVLVTPASSAAFADWLESQRTESLAFIQSWSAAS